MSKTTSHHSTPTQPGQGIKDFFRGRSIFITGSTGYMGKVLLEKLLRTCADVGVVYLLLRPKSSMEPKRRVEELLQSKVFDRLKKESPASLAKLVPVSGDITNDGLGLSDEDRQRIVEEVAVVFHAAATIKFDEELRNSININVLGTKRVLDLCSKMRNLVAVIYISTAYCNCDRDEIDEVVYPLCYSPKKIAEAAEWMDDAAMASLTPHLIGNRPNTYTYTKALAEQLLTETYCNLPVAIIRPSMVLSSAEEPFPGWIENLNGPTGYVVGYAKGIVRCVLCHTEMVADFVPVDFTINLIIAAAWYTAVQKPNSLLVFNCTSGSRNRLTWGDFQNYVTNQVLYNPVSGVVWYPSMVVCRNKFSFDFFSKLMAIFPASFLDMVARMTGRKPLMVRVQQKFQKVYASLQYFTNHEWKFTNDNVMMLWDVLSPQDQQDFNFDVRSIDWKRYMDNYFTGTKLYILKENLSAFPAARHHLRKMFVIFYVTQLLGFVIVWRLIVTRFTATRRLQYLIRRLLRSVAG